MRETGRAAGILIDDRGEKWDDKSPALAQRLGYRDPDFDVPGYAVRNLGFIHVRQHGEGVRVSLRSQRYSLLSLTSALYVLLERRPRRIVLAVFENEEWSFEMFTSLGAFAERTEDLAAGEPVAGRPRWLAAEKEIDALAQPTLAKVRPVVDLWKANRGRLDRELHEALRAADLTHRAVLVRQIPGTSRLIYEHFGAAIKMMRPCEAFAMVGRDVENVPDKAYGAWVAESYAKALSGRRVRLDAIRATLRTSQASTVRVRYDRLLMPWYRAGTDLWVLSVSMRRQLSTVA
jgi:hypothetical protein